jgi:uracil-DNA glycosylase
MRWSERQVAMLAEMGIRLWTPAAQVGAPNESAGSATAEAGRATAVEHRPEPGPARATPTPPAEARATVAQLPVRAAALDWPALRDAVAACTACKLCENRRQTVFGVGSEQAHWMIVGEAPGEREDELGEPFVGKSGQLLDNMLAAIGLTRGEAEPAQQVYIANAIKCRPPGNRNPEAAELATCEPFLSRQVQLLKPKIILAMGSFAVRSLLRTAEPIGKLRGRVHHFEGVPLIVTYHPAYLLRNLQEKARAWDDLCLALETVGAAPTSA